MTLNSGFKQNFSQARNKLQSYKRTLQEFVKTIEDKNKASDDEKDMFDEHLNSLKQQLNTLSNSLENSIKGISLNNNLKNSTNNAKKENLNNKKPDEKKKFIEKKSKKENKEYEKKSKSNRKPFFNLFKKSGKEQLLDIEKETLERFKKSQKKTKKKKPEQKKPSKYFSIASKNFYKSSTNLIKEGKFRNLKRDLIKSHLQITTPTYISMMFFTTILSFLVALILGVFFLFFDLSVSLPIISFASEPLLERLFKVISLLFIIPPATYGFIYFYPSMEKKSNEIKVNQELPFATMHMAAISASLSNQSKIFEIVITTGEYPALNKEFRKLLNQINIYGADLITALRTSSFNSPSEKLSELYNGLATTITSGGDLSSFFEKRAESLLFDHKLEREKYNKYAETFMDIYISVVIAAPMILMLLLIMMKVSGLGVALSTNMLTLVMVLAVSLINALFLVFLHLRQPPS